MSQSSSRIFSTLSVVSLILAIGALAVTIVRPGPAGPQGPTGAAGATGLTGATGATGPSGVVSSILLQYSQGTADLSPTTTAKQLSVIGNFTKISATTTLEVIWDSHGTGAGGGLCNFQIRVDGIGIDRAGPVINADGGYYPMSMTTMFTGLPAGNHTLTVWDRGVAATSCGDDVGNYYHSVIVIEFQI